MTSLPALIFLDFKNEVRVDVLQMAKEKNTKVVYWDLGGTLVDIPDKIKNQIINEINIACKSQISLAVYDELIRKEWKCRETPEAQKKIKSVKTDEDELAYWSDFFACALKKFNVQLKAPQLLLKLAKTQANEKSFEIYPYVQDILTKLEDMGIRVGIISNAFPSARRILKQTKLIQKFSNEHIFLSYEYNSIKPEERIYKKAIKKAGVEANQILFIDDRKYFLEGADKLGINAVIVTTEIQYFAKHSDSEKPPKPLENVFDFINKKATEFSKFYLFQRKALSSLVERTKVLTS